MFIRYNCTSHLIPKTDDDLKTEHKQAKHDLKYIFYKNWCFKIFFHGYLPFYQIFFYPKKMSNCFKLKAYLDIKVCFGTFVYEEVKRNHYFHKSAFLHVLFCSNFDLLYQSQVFVYVYDFSDRNFCYMYVVFCLVLVFWCICLLCKAFCWGASWSYILSFKTFICLIMKCS